MARIVYGVSGEGSGHSSRSREMINHLQRRGHTVKVVSYDRGYKNLRTDFDVFETEGLHISSADNRVSKIKTVTENLQKLSSGHKKYQQLRSEIFKGFQPDCVFTDFEPMTAYLAGQCDLPLITVDNQHRLRYMHYPCPRHLRRDKVLTRNIIRAMVPRPDVSLVTTFFYGEPLNDHTFLFPPILRREVLELQPVRGEHILVYLTGGFETFLSKLTELKRERFVVYGDDRSAVEGPLEYKPFSRTEFLRDLAGCKAVMATAGFTLMTEAMHLRKPYLALPMRGQFEQEINAYFLDRLGYGRSLKRPIARAIGDFLYRLPDYESRLEEYDSKNNAGIETRIDSLLENGCEQARKHHDRRKDLALRDGLPAC